MDKRYQDTVSYIFGLQRYGVKWSLDNIRALLDAVDNPHLVWPAIHIAGTNGKGSTAAITESILLQEGYNVGLYTSPHLVDFTERIRVNRELIAKSDVVTFTDMIRPVIARVQPSFFEVTTAMAFWYFARRKVDIAVIETGMGGRLDSTNVVNPLATIITRVGMDHQQYLGNTIGEIAGEKAGIIKAGIPCITTRQKAEALTILREICKKKGSDLIECADNYSYRLSKEALGGTHFELFTTQNGWLNLHLNLTGSHQVENALMAIAAIEAIQDSFLVSADAIVAGINDVIWSARIDLVSTAPNIMIDVSHNADGVEKTLSVIHQHYSAEKIKAITYLQEDKDYQDIARLLTKGTKEIFIVQLKTGKPLNPELYRKAIENEGGKVRIIPGFEDMKELIFADRGSTDLWLIIGSHFLAGEAYLNLEFS